MSTPPDKDPGGGATHARHLAKAGWAGFGVGISILCLYLSSLTADNTHDTVYFAMSAEAAVANGAPFLGLFFPSHVLHQPAAAILLWMAHAIGLQVGGLIVLQVMSSVGGALLAGFVTRLLVRRTGHVALGVATGLAVGLAGGDWFFAVDGECNLISLALAVAALGPVQGALDGDRRAGMLAAILLALSCGWHLTLGTLWIAILVVATAAGWRVMRRGLLLLSGASVLLAVLYLPRLYFLLQEPGPFNPLDLVTFTKDVVEGGYLMSSGFDPLGELGGMVHGFVTTAPDSPWRIVALVFGVLPLGALAIGMVAVLRRRADRFIGMLWVWFAATLTLYAAWANVDFEFSNFLLVPAALLGASALARLIPSPRVVTGLAVAVAVVSLAAGALNWRLFIQPGLDPAASQYHRIADMVAANTRPQDRVVVCGLERTRLKIYVLYHAKRAAIIPEFLFGPQRAEDDSVRAFEAALDAACATDARVYSLAEMVDDIPLREVKGFPLERLRAIVRARHPVEVARTPDGGLYLLDCPPSAKP